MAQQNGGPVFPREDVLKACREGMTVRDYFAAKTLTGLLANSEGVHAEHELTESYLMRGKENRALYANFCYQMADAMLKARES